MSGQYSDFDDTEGEFGKALSIHSLEKRRIPHKPGDDDNLSHDSVMIDNTLSPSPQKKVLGSDPKQGFLKRLGSTNIDSGDTPHEYKNSSPNKGPSKLSRMDSYEVSKGNKHSHAQNLSPDIIRPEKMLNQDPVYSKPKPSGKPQTKPQLKNLPK